MAKLPHSPPAACGKPAFPQVDDLPVLKPPEMCGKSAGKQKGARQNAVRPGGPFERKDYLLPSRVVARPSMSSRPIPSDRSMEGPAGVVFLLVFLGTEKINYLIFATWWRRHGSL